MKRIGLFLLAVVMVAPMFAGCDDIKKITGGSFEDDTIIIKGSTYIAGDSKPVSGEWTGTASGKGCRGDSVTLSLSMDYSERILSLQPRPEIMKCGAFVYNGIYTSTTTLSGTWKLESGGGGTFSMKAGGKAIPECKTLSFQAPSTLSANKDCGYGSTNCAVPGKYHTAIDYSGSGNALATADGTVERVEAMGSGDHGMGNNVIIKHRPSTCSDSYVYSTYSHLASIDSKMKKGDSVSKNQKVGVIGGSGYGSSNYWGAHLHFEIKDSPVTGSPHGGSFWGYTPNYPDNYGYLNPRNFY